MVIVREASERCLLESGGKALAERLERPLGGAAGCRRPVRYAATVVMRRTLRSGARSRTIATPAILLVLSERGEDFFAREAEPHAPDTWIDTGRRA